VRCDDRHPCRRRLLLPRHGAQVRRHSLMAATPVIHCDRISKRYVLGTRVAGRTLRDAIARTVSDPLRRRERSHTQHRLPSGPCATALPRGRGSATSSVDLPQRSRARARC
jgi:hypothetical protein